ncbi:peptidoglycan-binding LysM [Ophiocordyceps camponoti-floridani]|uniref:Peptidoglycan-binding LysM n=1 Tax=Ophiocordyceps camponoti-floridani TaxID=2030778 RepID=A0A8H4QDW5_9HYPO|nr:peptidoglycan-binding LysM [Ophiocordyceps camponoti-floridani]
MPDSDDERLPEGMTRIGYDADSQIYTFRDTDGSYWESAPGCRHGRLTRVGDCGPDTEQQQQQQPFLHDHHQQPFISWRHEMMPLLNFGLLIGLSLLLLFWYLHWAADDSSPTLSQCASPPYVVRSGDTCWAIARARRLTVEDVIARNPALDCRRLAVGALLCLPP